MQQCHSDSTPIVALTTGWYNGGSRCLKEMAVAHQNATSTTWTTHRLWHCRPGGTTEGAAPCPNDIDATKAMWEVLGVPRDSCGKLDITWTDA
ncbi:hypothetical protein C3L33_07593, partial [Rhododendron williamsianum]